MTVNYEIENEGKIEKDKIHIDSFYLNDGDIFLFRNLIPNDKLLIKLKCIIKMRIYDNKNQLIYACDSSLKKMKKIILEIKWDPTPYTQNELNEFVNNLRKLGFKIDKILEKYYLIER